MEYIYNLLSTIRKAIHSLVGQKFVDQIAEDFPVIEGILVLSTIIAALFSAKAAAAIMLVYVVIGSLFGNLNLSIIVATALTAFVYALTANEIVAIWLFFTTIWILDSSKISTIAIN